MKTLEEKIATLPNWAQEHIGVLQRNLDNAKTQIKQISRTEECESLVSYETSSVQGNLLDRTRVKFRLSDKRSIEVSLHEKMLHVYAEGGTLVLKPEITNVINITVADYWEKEKT